jgi:hypothetical protein
MTSRTQATLASSRLLPNPTPTELRSTPASAGRTLADYPVTGLLTVIVCGTWGAAW